MSRIFVIVEHIQGEIRDITYELLTKTRELVEKDNLSVTAILLGKEVKENSIKLSKFVEKVIVVKNKKLEHYNSEYYQKILSKIILDNKPLLIMMGHTSFGMDLAPRLAAALEIPLATDCIDFNFNKNILNITRQMYGGKVNVNATLKTSKTYMLTIRQSTFSVKKTFDFKGKIVEIPFKFNQDVEKKQFLEYISPSSDEVDITTKDILVSIGRGIKEKDNIPMIEELAKELNGVLSCSRPIVDKGWLSNSHQVGSSGKTVKPKLYIAIGISGSFQHILGMKNSELIIAINKDPKAPIFNYADYGIIGDLFDVIPQLKNKLVNFKS